MCGLDIKVWRYTLRVWGAFALRIVGLTLRVACLIALRMCTKNIKDVAFTIKGCAPKNTLRICADNIKDGGANALRLWAKTLRMVRRNTLRLWALTIKVLGNHIKG
jgi:hypothetical protein